MTANVQIPDTISVGVLALQGSFREHMSLLNMVEGVSVIEVRTKEELESVSGLIIPGEPEHIHDSAYQLSTHMVVQPCNIDNMV